MSRHSADLEQRLGTRLLQRTTRRQSLTTEGQQFHLRTRELLAGVEEAESEMGARSGEACGKLRINAPLSFGVLHLVPLWGRFAERHPGCGWTSRWATGSLTWWRSWSTRDEWRFDGPDGPEAVRIRPVLRANNGDTCRAAALDHQGVILQPDFLVGADLRSGALVELMPQYRSLRIGINAVYPSGKHLPLKVRRMVEFLVESFATPPWALGARNGELIAPKERSYATGDP